MEGGSGVTPARLALENFDGGSWKYFALYHPAMGLGQQTREDFSAGGRCCEIQLCANPAGALDQNLLGVRTGTASVIMECRRAGQGSIQDCEPLAHASHLARPTALRRFTFNGSISVPRT